METTPIYDLVYRITESDYEAFNLALIKKEVEKRKKRSRVLGIFEVIVGVLMLVSMLTAQAKSETLYYVLDILLILMGTYSLSFYKFIFPKKLKKASSKNYASNPYLNNDVHVTIYDDSVHEHSFEVDNIVEWDEFSKIQLTSTLLMLILKNNKCIIIPLREIDNVDKLDSFLTGIHDVWGIEYIKER